MHIFCKTDQRADFAESICFCIGIGFDVAIVALPTAEARDTVDRFVCLESIKDAGKESVSIIGMKQMFIPLTTRQQPVFTQSHKARNASRPLRRRFALHPSPMAKAGKLLGFAQLVLKLISLCHV